jgi:hypothetical protein
VFVPLVDLILGDATRRLNLQSGLIPQRKAAKE